MKAMKKTRNVEAGSLGSLCPPLPQLFSPVGDREATSEPENGPPKCSRQLHAHGDTHDFHVTAPIRYHGDPRAIYLA